MKPPPDRKSRLAGVLAPEKRDAIVRDMAAHVVAACLRAPAVDHVAVLAPDAPELPPGVSLLADPGGGLNAAVASAAAELEERGASRLIVLAGDLPLVTPGDIASLAAVSVNTIGIAPDRHGSGTNALSLPLPAAAGFGFAYGEGSFARHRAEAERLGLEVVEVRSEGLARDVDLPADLADAASLTGAIRSDAMP